MDQVVNTLKDMAVRYGFTVLGAVFIIFAGVVLARKVGQLVQGWLDDRELEPPVRLLIVRVVRLLIMAFVSMIAVQHLGVNLVPLVAGLSVVGVGVGLAMQGVLSNVLAGVLIIFIKPFRVGEYIELLGVHGEVTNIELISTTLVHLDRSLVKIPNRKILGEILHNYGKIRQLDIKVGVAYDTDLRQALDVIGKVLAANPRILRDPAPVTGVVQLADSSIEIAVKPWVALADFVPAHAEVCQTIVESFRQKGIEIPFPQQEVRFLNQGPAGRTVS
jgi:small conductance mechanosensitive channel